MISVNSRTFFKGLSHPVFQYVLNVLNGIEIYSCLRAGHGTMESNIVTHEYGMDRRCTVDKMKNNSIDIEKLIILAVISRLIRQHAPNQDISDGIISG